MLKAGIFVDVDNIMRNGGNGMNYRRLRELVEAQGARVVRANTYAAYDEEYESQDRDRKARRDTARAAIRREGYNVVLKPTRKYENREGGVTVKSNVDLDIAVDALIQAQNLDYVLLVSGDGDYIKLVKALQSQGKRVDVLGFSNVSGELKRECDYFWSGYLVPGIVPPPKDDPNVQTGFLHYADEAKGFGFITMYTGLKAGEYRDDVYVHITDVKDENGVTVANTAFGSLFRRQAVLEFDLETQANGKPIAKRVVELKFS